MNIKQFETNLENVKKYSPNVYKETMKITTPFFVLHKKLFENGEEILKEKYSLNQSELDILAALYYMNDNNFSMTPTELYEVLLFSSGGMTKILKKLETKRLIVRIDNKEDKRSKLVQLTQKGKEITAKALEEVVNYEDKYFSELNKEEQEQLSKLLIKVLRT